MDFLSKVSSKAGETIQTIKDSEITKKAKNYAEIPGLQVQIGKAEAAIKKAYEEIGEAYFNAHVDDETQEYEDLFTLIKAKKELNEILDQSDNVNHPSHYKQGNIECIDAMRQQFTKEEVVAFCKLNAIKYLWRSNHKGTPQQDIDKANWYLNQISSTYKGE